MSPAPKKDPRNRPNEPFGGFGTTFGRRGGRPLKKHQRALLDELYPQIALEPKWDDGAPLRGAIDPAGYFTGSQSEEIWMEIGYGGGEHLAALAAANRDKGIIGGEFFASGVGKMLVAIEEAGLDNVRLHKGDEILPSFEAGDGCGFPCLGPKSALPQGVDDFSLATARSDQEPKQDQYW